MVMDVKQGLQVGCSLDDAESLLALKCILLNERKKMGGTGRVRSKDLRMTRRHPF